MAEPTRIVTVREAKVALGLPLDKSDSDENVAACIDEATGGLEQELGYELVKGARTKLFDGKDRTVIAFGSRPILASPPPVVTENGSALVVSVGYSTAADVIADSDTGLFYRVPGPTQLSLRGASAPNRWSPGYRNISITATTGYDDNTCPQGLRRVVKYLAGLYFSQTDRQQLGIERRSDGQRSTDFFDDLPALYQRIIDAHKSPLITL